MRTYTMATLRHIELNKVQDLELYNINGDSVELELGALDNATQKELEELDGFDYTFQEFIRLGNEDSPMGGDAFKALPYMGPYMGII